MRAGILAALVLLSATAFSQARGTPASVTSPQSTGQFMVPTGVPASVTSLGPEGFTPGINPLFPLTGPKLNPLTPSAGRGIRGDHRHSDVVAVPVPVYYGYYPYYGYDYGYDQQQQTPQQPQLVQQQAQPQQLQIVVVDKRDEAKRAQENEAAVQAAAEPKKSNLSDPPENPAIFVFKDGTRKELSNFAVMAGNLYDLSDGKMVKIAMNTVDRDATIAANEQAGREISLP
jgi:hypothetical protein